MKKVFEIAWGILSRLWPDILDFVQNAIDRGEDPDKVADLYVENANRVTRNRAKIDDQIEDKFDG